MDGISGVCVCVCVCQTSALCNFQKLGIGSSWHSLGISGDLVTIPSHLRLAKRLGAVCVCVCGVCVFVSVCVWCVLCVCEYVCRVCVLGVCTVLYCTVCASAQTSLLNNQET